MKDRHGHGAASWVSGDVISRPHPHLLGDDFSAADIMMGFTLVAARALGVLDERYPTLDAYLARLQGRPAFQKVLAVG